MGIDGYGYGKAFEEVERNYLVFTIDRFGFGPVLGLNGFIQTLQPQQSFFQIF